MRTSKLSQDTSTVLKASTPTPRRSTRTAIGRFSHNIAIKNEDTDSVDIEDLVPLSRKRKAQPSAGASSDNSRLKTEIKIEAIDTITTFPTKERKIRKPARQVKNEETGEVEIHPPNDWAQVYAVVKDMRTRGVAQNAAVDTMGCERLAEENVPPIVKRFHTLTALMLSSQTKDTTTAATMNKLYSELPPYKKGAPKGLNLENILAVDPKLLNELIWAVGFHNNKTRYIKATAKILRDQWGGDIPDTIEGLMSLPGVGPKMGYLCLSSAWGKTEGIGVDVHVHRITNLWGWQKTKGPEETRLALQAWLPKELWHEINWLLVGFGQTICLPVGRKCGECDLGLNGLCKAAERSKVSLGRKLKEELIKTDEAGNVVEKTESIKMERVTEDIPVNADPEPTTKPKHDVGYQTEAAAPILDEERRVNSSKKRIRT